MRLRIILLCGLLLPGGPKLLAQKVEKVADSVVDAAALCFTQGAWGICVNGQSFQQDALTSFNGFEYATY